MNDRKLVAALACRANGTRLYGKPLQNLSAGHSILDHILDAVKQTPEISETVLGISEGIENLVFSEVAKKHDVQYIFGHPEDVLSRLIQCARIANATDVFRVTTECPFVAWELVQEAWKLHLEEQNDVTVTDLVPLGCHFEIYRLPVLEKSHVDGQDGDRSEFCSAYVRRNHEMFKIGFVMPPENMQYWTRLTVDYPEDLVLCRQIYSDLGGEGPRIELPKIVSWLKLNPEKEDLVKPLIGDAQPYWECVIEDKSFLPKSNKPFSKN